jgi:hypothetical protein
MAKKPAPKPPANKPNNNNNKPSNNNKPNNNKPNNNNNNNKPSNNKPSNNKPAAAAPKPQQNAPSLPSYQNDRGPAGNTAPTTSPLSIEDAQASRDSNAKLRNPNRDATHWTNADYGASFGMKDIKEWQERWGQGKNKKGERDGYKNNDIMKIAQAAYAGGDVKKVNKLNEYFGKMNKEWYDPNGTGEAGQPINPWAAVHGKPPKNAFAWNGFGNGMTKYGQSGALGLGGSYAKGSQWSLPTGFMGGFSPTPTDPVSSDLTDTAGPTDDGSGVDPEFGVEPEAESNPSMNQGGYGDDTTNWATSWRGATGTRAKSGRRGQGTGSMTNKGPAANAYGVGVRY